MSSATRTVTVPGISCEHCKTAIESSVGAVPGVTSVLVDVDAKTVEVAGGSDGDVIAAIGDAGYDVA